MTIGLVTRIPDATDKSSHCFSYPMRQKKNQSNNPWNDRSSFDRNCAFVIKVSCRGEREKKNYLRAMLSVDIRWQFAYMRW